MANWNKIAMENLNYTIADLRDAAKRAEIKAEAERMREASKSSERGSQLRQADIAAALDTFEGFRDSSMYGPTVADLAAHLTGWGGAGNIHNTLLSFQLVRTRTALLASHPGYLGKGINNVRT